jgi:hypothetical protein
MERQGRCPQYPSIDMCSEKFRKDEKSKKNSVMMFDLDVDLFVTLWSKQIDVTAIK